MIGYDATGRASWSEFMARHGVVPGKSAAPFDGRAIARGGLR